MIITNPTGLLRPLLPTAPDDPGNFTYTISTEDPPRSSEIFVQLPRSEEIRQSSPRVFTKQEMRTFLGQLVYDITKAGPPDSGSGDQQFEIGEVLEFTDDEETTADPYEFEEVQLRQDTKVVDFEQAGLSQEDYARLVNASQIRLEELTIEIATASTRLKANSTSIAANQAAINNSNAILDNIVVVLGENDPSATKVKNTIAGLEEGKQRLLSERDRLQSELDVLVSELDRVRESVR